MKNRIFTVAMSFVLLATCVVTVPMEKKVEAASWDRVTTIQVDFSKTPYTAKKMQEFSILDGENGQYIYVTKKTTNASDCVICRFAINSNGTTTYKDSTYVIGGGHGETLDVRDNTPNKKNPVFVMGTDPNAYGYCSSICFVEYLSNGKVDTKRLNKLTNFAKSGDNAKGKYGSLYRVVAATDDSHIVFRVEFKGSDSNYVQYLTYDKSDVIKKVKQGTTKITDCKLVYKTPIKKRKEEPAHLLAAAPNNKHKDFEFQGLESFSRNGRIYTATDYNVDDKKRSNQTLTLFNKSNGIVVSRNALSVANNSELEGLDIYNGIVYFGCQYSAGGVAKIFRW